MQTEYVLQPTNPWIQRLAVCSVTMTFLTAGAPVVAEFISGGFVSQSPSFPTPVFSPSLITSGPWDLSPPPVVATSTLLDPFPLRTISVPNTLATYYYTIGAVGPGFVIAHGDASASGTASGGGPATNAQLGAGGSFGLGFFDNQFVQRTSSVDFTVLNNGTTIGVPANGYTTDPIFVPANATQYFTVTQGNHVFVRAQADPSHSPAEASGTVHSSWSASFVPGNTLQEACKAALQGSLHAAPATDNSLNILAFPTPNYNLTLQEAAALCGVHHFNWISHITHVPDDWTLASGGVILPHPSPANPLTDPFPGGGLTIYDASAGFSLTIHADPAYGGLNGVYYKDSSHSLGFVDSPRMPSDFYSGANDYIGFETSLVGVATDGTTTPTGEMFTWKDDAVYIPHLIPSRDPNDPGVLVGGAFFSTTDDGTLPPVVSGGVFDVQVVPEPSTLALGLFGALAIAFARIRCDRVKRRVKRLP